MTERPLCRDVSLAAASECLVDAATYLRAALLELRDAAGHALIALAQGPTMRASMQPMPEPSAEARQQTAQPRDVTCRACLRLMVQDARDWVRAGAVRS